MNRYSAEKLHHSKWTAVKPRNREKHFIVTRVLRDESEAVSKCLLEAVHSGREQLLDWRDLRDTTNWLQGWK